jgi:hypothetical protein
MLHQILLGAAGPTTIAVVVGSAIAYDRLREPHRDPTSPHPVVDQHTYSDACRRIQRLITGGDVIANLVHVRVLLTAMEQWLRGEIHTGPRRKKFRRVAQLDQVHLAQEQTALLFVTPGGAPTVQAATAAHETLERIATLMRAARTGNRHPL